MLKKIMLFAVATMVMTFASFAANDAYVLDDNAIDQAFAQATEVSSVEIADNLAMPFGTEATAQIKAASPWAAFALCWVLGGFGIHRHYMGTSKGMWALYTFTCGGIFGIVTFVDWIVLLIGAIQNNISAYENNTKFFMWL